MRVTAPYKAEITKVIAPKITIDAAKVGSQVGRKQVFHLGDYWVEEKTAKR